ncbi:heme NO-binding domain-containing protein [Pelagerythrobacter sp.]|uniref:heme NO-binding domain-containing protein n=1 Tax=Pelagerythrobacter sp. TaxID=2800702 RepID=UPI0035AF8D49
MKGVIFNLLERVVTDEFGADIWDDLIDEAGVSGAYSSLGNYADEDIEALVAAAAAKTGQTRAQVLHWFGVHAMPLLRELYPSLFDPHATSQDFVLSVNEMIHPEVRKLYPDAVCPFFHVRRNGDNAVSLQYESQRDMIDLAHGFLDGAAVVYGDKVAVEKPGGASDRLDASWTR